MSQTICGETLIVTEANMLPEAFLSRMEQQLQAEFPAFLSSYDRPRNAGLRFNPLKAETPPSVPFSLTPIPWEPNGFYYPPDQRPGLHPWHDAGLYYLQEPSAMAPVTLLAPRPEERVLDLCAAPGGKSTQIAAAMGNRGLLVCNEIHPKRAAVLSQNIERMGISCALVLNEHPARLAERFAGYFDRILVDAPCSGEGMFRKETAAVTDWSLQTVQMCADRQTEILRSAAAMLRPGGRLVYSTCTFAPEEDEGTVSRFLSAHPDFALEAVRSSLFSPGRPDWVPGCLPELSGAVRLWPHKLAGEGHFAAVLRRTAGEEHCPAEQSAPAFPAELSGFLQENGICLPEGTLVQFGQTLYLAPPALPCLSALKVVRPGLELGRLQKGRFEPAHALALWLHQAAQTADFPPESREISAYLRGQTLPGAQRGWTLITAGGLSLGWAKGSGGILKNHYPKGLRHY